MNPSDKIANELKGLGKPAKIIAWCYVIGIIWRGFWKLFWAILFFAVSYYGITYLTDPVNQAKWKKEREELNIKETIKQPSKYLIAPVNPKGTIWDPDFNSQIKGDSKD